MAQEFWPLARRDEGESQGARGITNAAKRPKEQARLLPLFVSSDLSDGIPREIHDAGGFPLLQRIEKRDGAGFDFSENLPQRMQIVPVRRGIRPHGKDAAGAKVTREIFQPVRRVERGVTGMQDVPRGVVNIQQDGMKTPGGIFRIQAGGTNLCKKIRMDKTAARIVGKFPTQRDESRPMPFDDGSQEIDHEECLHAGFIQRRPGGVAKPEAAHHNVKRVARNRSKTQGGQGDFNRMEETRHEKLLPQLHFINIPLAEGGNAAAAQGQFPQRGVAMIEFFKVYAHTRIKNQP